MKFERAFCFVMLCVCAIVYMLHLVIVGRSIMQQNWLDAFLAALLSGFWLFGVYAYRKRDEWLAAQLNKSDMM